jgi:aryl-phospho-beta-D-glucosidase BglC (GH1 family)
MAIEPDAHRARLSGIWKQVAEAYQGYPDTLYFELLNEPELSVSGTPPSAEQWTALASDMIAAIRTHDTTHGIIFGDVGYYGTVPLSEREPFADDNIVYAFHFYEPFVFTHQGAAWVTGMVRTHDIPYPYSEDRWSEYSSTFGFSNANLDWQLSALRSYYATGNKSDMRNRVAQAKAWGVEHGVPVICNEFGPYDRTSQAADRVRYLTDIIDVFEELEIPWQTWFMLMDAGTGAMDPEIVAALGLSE